MPPDEQRAGGQIVAEEPPPRLGGDESHGASRPLGPGGARSALLASPVLQAVIACIALAALSAALLPTVPSYDPWAWIVWGREVVDPHLSFATGGGPSWKPLPVLFTTAFGLLGGAAPTLWVITARAAGLLALVAAYRLAARIAGRVAGAFAILGLVLTQDWAYYMFRGTSEPMLVGACLWAIERHLSGRRGQAFLLAVAASLIRPEAWPFLGTYAIWLWIKEPRLRLVLLAGVAAVPALWFLPPWVGSGQPFLAASHAKAYNGHLGKHPGLEALRRAGDLQVLPVLIAAAVALAFAWVKRERLVLSLVAGALVWVALVVLMAIGGYPGLERFFLPAAGIFCVLAGVGLERLSLLAGGGFRTGIAAVVLAAIAVPLSSARIDSARAQKPLADRAVSRLQQLSAAAAAVGGHRGVFPCRSSFSAVNHGVQTALAYKLHVTLGRVGTSLRHPGVLFVGPHDTIDGGPAPVRLPASTEQLLARVGAWRVYRVTVPGRADRCVGS